MNRVSPPASNALPAVADKVRELCRASQQVTEEIFDPFTVSNFTIQRTLNGSTATLSDVVNVLCTIINDMRNRGTKRVF